MKMKSFLSVMSLFVVMFFSVGAFAQQKGTSNEDNNIYNEVTSYASFAQGKDALVNAVINATHYPESEKVSGKGKEVVVMTHFIVEKDGTISNIGVETGENEAFDAEAIRVVSSIKGTWVPAQKNGVIVRSMQYIPVGFVSPKK